MYFLSTLSMFFCVKLQEKERVGKLACWQTRHGRRMCQRPHLYAPALDDQAVAGVERAARTQLGQEEGQQVVRLTVEPGFGGQKFMIDMMPKVRVIGLGLVLGLVLVLVLVLGLGSLALALGLRS